MFPPKQPTRPWGLKWRSSVWFVTIAVGFGITTDLLVYSIIIPVMPFQLEHLGYHGVSALTGWLLCAYSAGLVVSTIPIAIFSERYMARKYPLIIGLFALLGSQVLLMEAPSYAVMAVARVLQGISSSMVWIVGLALLCDTTPESQVGRQIGFAITGLSVGLLVGSPAGGELYKHYGFHGPFIFGEICTVVDLIFRLLIIERKDALRWGYDPAAAMVPRGDAEGHSSPLQLDGVTPQTSSALDGGQIADSPELLRDAEVPAVPQNKLAQEIDKPLPLLQVIAKMAQSSRAMAALGMALVYGIVNSMQEPSLPLHLQDKYHFGSDKVGLVYLAAVVPALISSPLAGVINDRRGAEWLTTGCLLFCLPWWILLTLNRGLPLFVVALALQCFFVSGVVPPVTAELAAVSRKIKGMGFAHVYGAFNLAFGFGTAVGPVMGGQIYDRARYGWTAVCSITAALIIICILLAFAFTGADPLLAKFLREVQHAYQDPRPAKQVVEARESTDAVP
ncbi:MFS general substrate transporter [Coniophora puteana RWD-64-598 SS2]|uniref:MFS general substrate transporter n=1 Tax=Coniophora puteana (strain RWD-64-598) TaxID=741705 RepID=A0A5M3N681_CONPW|nr:MFS general substrate transporter [Coniophora puteana RWD-64-598 SS2]EIW86381.1 MFS general substrate transporter [Coniophora puteana RWD-64-598 SS2]